MVKSFMIGSWGCALFLVRMKSFIKSKICIKLFFYIDILIIMISFLEMIENFIINLVRLLLVSDNPILCVCSITIQDTNLSALNCEPRVIQLLAFVTLSSTKHPWFYHQDHLTPTRYTGLLLFAFGALKRPHCST